MEHRYNSGNTDIACKILGGGKGASRGRMELRKVVKGFLLGGNDTFFSETGKKERKKKKERERKRKKERKREKERKRKKGRKGKEREGGREEGKKGKEGRKKEKGRKEGRVEKVGLDTAKF